MEDDLGPAEPAALPSGAPVEVRALVPEEWRLYRAVRLAALREAPSAFGSSAGREEGFTEERWRERLAARRTVAAFADGGAEPVGLAGWVPAEDGAAELVSMWTAPAARGRSVGARLVEAVLDDAAECGAAAARLWVVDGNAAAERLYARCGFAADGAVQRVTEDDPADLRVEHRMARALPGAVLERVLEQRVVHAARAAFGVELTSEQALVRPASAAGGADFQSNAALSLAGRLGLPARKAAELLAGRVRCGAALEEPAVSGPGFVNLRLRPEFLAARVGALAGDARLGVPLAARRERVVVDYSSPNAAKELQAHHLRSTVLGDAVVRLLRFLGHEVVRQNHLGDWGTQFGMLLEHAGTGGGTPSHGGLTEYYRAARARFDGEPGFADRARERLALLHSGDPASRRTWQLIVDASLEHLAEVYGLLGVELEPGDVRGESWYGPLLEPLAAELAASGAARESDGALCLFPPGWTGRDGAPLPLLLRKRGGGFTYAATDLAAVRYRVRELAADRVLYVVGAPQEQHLGMVFAGAREAGLLPDGPVFEHVPFGSVLGEDGRMLRTRAGGAAVSMLELLREGVERAAALTAERTRLPEGERPAVARAVGIGAAKYAALAGDREKDTVFSLDRMLAMDGNTAVYLQYAHARMCSVLRRAGDAGDGAGGAPPAALHEPAERGVALALLRTPGAVLDAAGTFRPHRLCRQLYEVAAAFSAFWEACPVLGAGDPGVRAARLQLCAVSARTLATGLGLLGIEAPEEL